MPTHHFILATAGHVDHGKSAIVKALTGIDPDRLPEEKARGITIDLGFAHLELRSPVDPALSFHIGIVDVPGHEDFVKNMVAGVGSIDLALLIVAADDTWMPQTEEHLQILTYLGVTRAVVALTKIDLIESEAGRSGVVEQIRNRLQNSPFAGAPIVPTSALRGIGLEELKSALANAFAQTALPRDIGKPRLPVDRVFTLKGIGTVVTGTLSGGTLRRGQNVVIQPAGLATRIRTLQSHNRDVETSVPGTRTAVNLPDAGARSEPSAQGLKRGDVITLPELGGPSDALDVLLEKSGRLADSKSGAARPIKDGALVRVHHGSGNFTARIALAGREPLLPGERRVAQLRAESPVFAFAGDHFIVRDWAEQWTLAGGVVLDADGNRKSFRREPYQQFLQRRAGARDDVNAFVLSQLVRDGAVQKSKLLLKSRFSQAEIAAGVERLRAQGQAVIAGEFAIYAAAWETLKKQAAEAIETEHRQHPQHAGLALSELRARLEHSLPAPALFDVLVADLCRGGFSQLGTAIRKTTHRPALPPQLQSAGAKVRAALSAKPLDPPSRKELAPDAATQQALRFLVQTGEATEVGPEIVLLTEAYARAVEVVKQFLRERRQGTVSELRQAIGASRRIVVPLLEKLDREGVTKREGDQRVLR